MALGGGSTEGIQVPIEGDSSGLNSALEGGIGKLNDFRGAVAAAGGVLATMAAKGLKDSITAAADFEAAMADVEKVTDPQTMEEMRGEIQEMATSIPMAQEELAGLATQAGRMGAEGTEEVAAFTEVAASMGAATALSADEAGTALGKLSSALNEPLEDAGKLGDAINEVSNNFATDSGEIVDAAQRSGQALSELGMESDSIIGLAGAFNEVSPTSRLAASRMQMVGEAMMDPENVDMFADALGVTAEEFTNMREESPEDTMMNLMDAVDEGKLSYEELSGQLTKQTARAFRDTASSADTMREAMETSNTAMEEGGSLANEVAVETDTAAGQWELLKNRARNLAIQIGDNLLPYIREFLEVLTRGLDWFEAINEATDGWAATIGLLVGLVGGLIAAGGALISMMGGLTAVAGSLTAGFTGIATAAAAVSAPMLALIGVVAALAAAWATDFAGIRSATERVVGVLMERLQPAIEWLQTNGVPIALEIRDAFLEFVNTVEPYLRPLITLIADGLIAAINGLFDVLERVIPPAIAFMQRLGNDSGEALGTASTAFNDLRDTVVAVVARIRGVLAPLIAWLRARWTEFDQAVLQEMIKTWRVVSQTVAEVAADIRSTLQPLFAYLNEWVLSIVNLFTTYFQGLHQDLVAVFNAMTTALRTIWEMFGDEIIAYVRFWIDLITGIFSTFWDGLLALWQAQLQLLRGDWEAALETIKTFLRDTLNGIIEFARSWGGRFLEWLGGLIDSVLEWFRSLYQDLIGGSIIPEMFTAILEAARGFGQSLIEWLAGLVEAFISNIEAFVQRLIQKFTGLWNDLLAAARGFGEDVISWLTGLVEAFISNIEAFVQRLIQKFAGLWNDLLAAARGFGEDVLGWLNEMTSRFISKLTTFASDVVDEFGDMGSKALSKIEGLTSDFYNAGKSLVTSLKDGIASKARAAKREMSNLAGGLRDRVPGSDAEEGPLSDLSEAGPAIPIMLAEGMTDELRDLDRAAEEVAAHARPALEAEATAAFPAAAAAGGRTVEEGDNVNLDIDVTIEGDASRHEVERGLSRALQSYNVER